MGTKVHKNQSPGAPPMHIPTDPAPANAGSVSVRARTLLARTRSLGIGVSQLQKVLGLSRSYLIRVMAEAEAEDRSDSPSSRRFLNERILSALEGICELVTPQPTVGTISVSDYEATVAAEIEALCSGDMHTLVTVLPPLERDRDLVRRAVVTAAAKGARFRYHFPSSSLVADFYQDLPSKRPTGVRPRASGSQHLPSGSNNESFDDVFYWVRHVEENVQIVMAELFSTAKKMDVESGRTPARTYRDALVSKVEFWQLSWLPISFDEKLIWITSQRPGSTAATHTFRKEVLVPDVSTGRLRVYDDKQQWSRVEYSLPLNAFCNAYRELVKHARKNSKPLSWAALALDPVSQQATA